MKKIFTLLAAVAIGTGAFAQRNIDLSVDSIVAPTELNSSFSAGTTIAVNAIIKNNGVDTAFAGDSLWWNMLLTNEAASQIILGFPSNNTNNFAIQIMTRDLLPGDTMHLTASLTTTAIPTASMRVALFITAHMINRTNNLPFEPTASQNNNIRGRLMTWFTPERWPVGINENVAGDLLNIYPNPATDKVTIESSFSDVTSATQLNVYDISGKLVYTTTASPMQRVFEVNTSDLKNGVYMVEVTAGSVINKSKIVVTR